MFELRGKAGLAALMCTLSALCCAVPALAAGRPEAHEGWAQSANQLQYELGSDVGFEDSTWIGTHNSFNSVGQTGVALSPLDANQQLTLVQQLDAGLRSLELDVHRFPDIPNGTSLKVCHGRGADQAHFGCTIEKDFAPTLAEIAAWMDKPGNADQVILLYIEDHMVDAAGYDAAAAAVSNGLGDRLYKPPPGGGCTEVPADLTRSDIRATGAQALIVSDCGPGTGWATVAFNWDSHVESRPVDYADFPDCGPDYDRATYDTKFVRYYEDSTALTNVVGPPTGVATPDDGITPPTAAAMVRCGVDLIGFDQFTGTADPRLEGVVWSWQVNRPRPRAAGGERACALQRTGVAVADDLGGGERSAWFDQRCNRLHAAACRSAIGTWRIVTKRGSWPKAREACEKRGLDLGTPRTGFQSEGLQAALEAAGVRQAWLGYRMAGGEWQAVDPPPADTD